MTFLTSPGFGVLLTIAALALCFASALMVDAKRGSPSRRRLVLAVTTATCCVWLAVIVARFLWAG